MRCLILAQGPSKRWAKDDGSLYLDRPKHLIVIDGETLLARTVRLLRARGVDDVIVVGPDDDRYRVAGARLVTLDDPFPTGHNLDKLYGTQPLWNPAGRTTLLFGDVFYTDDAIDTIVSHRGAKPHWFRRPGPSKLTGHRWDETFAFTFQPADHERILTVADAVTREAMAGRIKAAFMRCHYAAMIGARDIANIAAIRTTPHQTHLVDWTDDFDRWDEWCRWVARYYHRRLDVAVAIPWTGGDEHRQRAYRSVRAHYEDMGVPVVAGDDDTGGPYVNRSRARNNAIRAAITDHAPAAVFIADADTFVDEEQFWAASYLAIETGQLAIAFETFLRASHSATDRHYQAGRRRARRHSTRAGREAAASSRPLGGKRWHNHASCATAVTPALFETTGGYDERFTSWGGEDRSFWLACMMLAGVADRIPGIAYHLWHPASPERRSDFAERQAMIDLGMRYKRAAGYRRKAGVLPADDDADLEPDLEAFMAILREPGAPLDPGARADEDLMASRNSTVRVNVVGDARSGQKALRDIAGTGAQTESRFNAITAGIAAGFTARALPAVLSFASGFRTQATAIQASARLTDTVFKSSAKTINEWSDGAIDSMGMTSAEAQNSAAIFGRLFTGLKINSDQAAEMSMTLTGLSADLSAMSAGTMTAQQVQEGLSAAFRGEYDSLQRVIPSISDAAVKQRALAMTGKQSEQALTDQEKALAAYQIILEGSADAQGYFARNGDLATVESAKFSATLRELQGQLGQGLLPILSTTTSVLRPMAGWMSDNADATVAFGVAFASAFAISKIVARAQAFMQLEQSVMSTTRAARALGTTKVQFEALQASAASVTPAFTGATRSVGGFHGAMRSMLSSALSPATIATAGLTVGVGLLTYAWQRHQQAAAESRQRVQQAKTAFEELAKSVDGATTSIEDYVVEESRFNKRNQIDDLQRLGISYERLSEMIRAGSAGRDDFIASMIRTGEVTRLSDNQLRGMTQSAIDLAVKSGDLIAVNGAYYRGNVDLVKSYDEMAKGQRELVESQLKLAAGSDQLDQATRDQIASFVAGKHTTGEVIDYYNELEPTLREVSLAIGQSTKATDTDSAAKLDNVDATEQQIAALEALYASIFGLGGITTDVDGAFARFSSRFDSTSSAGGRAANSVDLVAEKQEKLRDATRSAEDALRSYEQSQRDVEQAAKDVARAERELEEAREGPSAEDQEEAQDDLTDARLSAEDAADAVTDAEEALAEARASGDQDLVRRKENDLAQARQRAKDANRAVTLAEKELNAIRSWSSETAPEVQAAQDALTEAQRRQRDVTADNRRKWEDLTRANLDLAKVQNASLASFGAATSSLGSNRKAAEDTRDAYYQLADSVKTAIAQILALSVTGAKKAEEIQRIRSLVEANPFLSDEQRKQLLTYIAAAYGAAMNVPSWATPGFAGYGAEGGRVKARPGGSLVVAAEAGEDEWMVPDSKMVDILASGAGAGARTVQYVTNVHLSVPATANPAAVGRQVRRVLREYDRRAGARG